MHLTIGVFNTTDDSHEFFFPALGTHHLTTYHTHWRHLTSSSFETGTVTVAMASSKSGALPSISLISCKIKVNWKKISTWNFEWRTSMMWLWKKNVNHKTSCKCNIVKRQNWLSSKNFHYRCFLTYLNVENGNDILP